MQEEHVALLIVGTAIGLIIQYFVISAAVAKGIEKGRESIRLAVAGALDGRESGHARAAEPSPAQSSEREATPTHAHAQSDWPDMRVKCPECKRVSMLTSASAGPTHTCVECSHEFELPR